MQHILLYLNISLHIKHIYIVIRYCERSLYINKPDVNKQEINYEFIIISNFVSYFIRILFLKQLQEYYTRARRILLPYMMPVAT